MLQPLMMHSVDLDLFNNLLKKTCCSKALVVSFFSLVVYFMYTMQSTLTCLVDMYHMYLKLKLCFKPVLCCTYVTFSCWFCSFFALKFDADCLRKQKCIIMMEDPKLCGGHLSVIFYTILYKLSKTNDE